MASAYNQLLQLWGWQKFEAWLKKFKGRPSEEQCLVILRKEQLRKAELDKLNAKVRLLRKEIDSISEDIQSIKEKHNPIGEEEQALISEWETERQRISEGLKRLYMVWKEKVGK